MWESILQPHMFTYHEGGSHESENLDKEIKVLESNQLTPQVDLIPGFERVFDYRFKVEVDPTLGFERVST